ncbi:tol-pal system protein YbgF [Chelativorans sp. ZYF759]|uniref:tol-pal system protein YbgF n=1 Tax=Chelativorans sp. ZYF759 TaxID=2692213 RepID=UPI00145C607E|nr:tol-pal system protein YbgF [Chelativorans sp. ZYF759]NMG40732.1 tol-pal system protein YbgF [Chelativorans sp. ZYF759]
MGYRYLLLVALAFPLMFSAPAMAQTDPRVSELEEQVRRLGGTVEELNFQILQMQDQIRRMQEDFEFRFQEIEQGGGGSSGAPSLDRQGSLPSQEPARDQTAEIIQQQGGNGQQGDSAQLGAPPREFGTIVFDAQGNVVGSSVLDNPPAAQTLPSAEALPSSQPVPADETVVAALPPSGDGPDSLYRNAYEFILSGDYATAEAGFQRFLQEHAGSENEPDARFWLGEAQLAQNKHRDAAETFLAASRDFPDSRKAPEMLYKLGVSLSGLNQRDVACATFAEVSRRYPQASEALMERVRQGQSAASC